MNVIHPSIPCISMIASSLDCLLGAQHALIHSPVDSQTPFLSHNGKSRKILSTSSISANPKTKNSCSHSSLLWKALKTFPESIPETPPYRTIEKFDTRSENGADYDSWYLRDIKASSTAVKIKKHWASAMVNQIERAAIVLGREQMQLFKRTEPTDLITVRTHEKPRNRIVCISSD